jgi:hypothetical protein
MLTLDIEEYINKLELVLGGFSAEMPSVLPIGRNSDGVDELLLLEDFHYKTLRGTHITVKAGFVFDGASIPKCAWSIIGSPFSSTYIRSALIHDILYVTEAFDREFCDKLFKEMLYQDRAADWKVPLMYSAVRIGGGFVWDKHEPLKVKEYKKYIHVY